MKNNILLKKYKLIETNYQDNNYEYLAAKLLNTFGVEVDKPEKLNHIHLKLISEFYGINIPLSFYNNPQDTKYYTTEELYLERLISYIRITVEGEHSDNPETFDRIELFKKVLPNYEEGKEVVLRKYNIITREQADKELEDYLTNLAAYTRPWSLTEREEFIWLYNNGYYNGVKIASKDNAIDLLLTYKVADFAKSIDQKDVVKLSIKLEGEQSKLNISKENKKLLTIAIENCYKAQMTKKQAKYFNTLRKHLNLKDKIDKVDNNNPYKEATDLIKKYYIVEAAEVFAKNGSMLERNLIWLLSRANTAQIDHILDMIEINNPVVVLQLVEGLLETKNQRTFRYYYDNKVRTYIETQDDMNKRKSVLSLAIKNQVKEKMYSKIEDYYRSLPSIGKVFIGEGFDKIALPMNTSASQEGLDVLPLGSRVPIKGDYIRAFTYWNNVFDIDTSVSFIKDGKLGTQEVLYWGNHHIRRFGHSALTSGDDRGRDGSEYIDFRISELRENGYTHAIYQLNGYGGKLNIGEIYTGYQNKDNLDTETWMPNNMELKIKVHGDSRTYMAFAIDLKTKEIIYLDQMLESYSRVITTEDFKSIERYLNKDYVDTFNIAKIASLRGEVVETPEEADVVFDNNYQTETEQKVLKLNDISEFVKLLTV